MARSLTVHHKEEPRTSSLLNSFLLLALGWLVLSMVAGAFAADPQSGVDAPPTIDAP